MYRHSQLRILWANSAVVGLREISTEWVPIDQGEGSNGNGSSEFTPGSDLWNAASNYMTGFGMAVDGSAYNLGVRLEQRLAYQFTRTTYHGFEVKTPPVNFRTPFGGVKVPTGFVKGIAKTLKVSGVSLGILGLGMTAFEIYKGQKNVVGEGGIDLVMGGVAFIPGGGWIISGVYFGGKWMLEATGNDFWNKP